MADVVTFDPVNLRIVEIDSGGDNELNVVEVYSEWKDWLLADPSRLGHPPAFREVGGDPISGTQSLGITYFLSNHWKIRPAERDHKLTLAGNLFTDPAGESAFVPTLGAFTVNTETRVSNLIDIVSLSGAVPSAAEIADAVWDEPASAHTAAGSFGELEAGHVALTAQELALLREVHRMLGLDVAFEVEHGQTYIRIPADGSLVNIAVTKVGSGPGASTTLQRL